MCSEFKNPKNKEFSHRLEYQNKKTKNVPHHSLASPLRSEYYPISNKFLHCFLPAI